MIIRNAIIFSLFFLSTNFYSQQISGIYSAEKLLNRIANKDTTYLVNFWATWCKPCVEELPAFDSLQKSISDSKIKILMVSLDFKEDIEKKVNPFLKKKNLNLNFILLDEINGNTYINLIDKNWSGAIPATLIIKGKSKVLFEKELSLNELLLELNKFSTEN